MLLPTGHARSRIVRLMFRLRLIQGLGWLRVYYAKPTQEGESKEGEHKAEKHGGDGHTPMGSSIRLSLGGRSRVGWASAPPPPPRSGELWGAFGEAKEQMKQRGVQIGFWAAMG